MEFRHVCTAAALLSLPFGLGFLIAPTAMATAYAVAPADPTTVLIARYFGSETLMYAAAAWNLRTLRDWPAQRAAAAALALATSTGLALTLQALLAGTLNALSWTSVALYGCFTLAWTVLALRSAGGAPRVA